MTDPLVDAGASPDELAFEGALRPTSLADFVGQPKVKGQLQVLLQAARLQDRAPDHILLAGPPGLGKTTLATIIGAETGRPIRYSYVPRDWPLATYQTVFATEPGSAEMPSAARPLTAEIVTRLVSRGVVVAPIVLHTGVSSLEGRERPYPERYRVPLASVLKANRLTPRTFIHPGQKVVVRGAAATATAARAAAQAGAGKGTAYTVRPGDTLEAIAIRHRTSVAAIARASGISTRALIHPGQRLTVPRRATASPAAPDTFNGVRYPRAVAEAAARNQGRIP